MHAGPNKAVQPQKRRRRRSPMHETAADSSSDDDRGRAATAQAPGNPEGSPEPKRRAASFDFPPSCSSI